MIGTIIDDLGIVPIDPAALANRCINATEERDHRDRCLATALQRWLCSHGGGCFVLLRIELRQHSVSPIWIDVTGPVELLAAAISAGIASAVSHQSAYGCADFPRRPASRDFRIGRY